MDIENIAYEFHPCGFIGCKPCYMKNYEAIEIEYVCNYLDRVVEANQLKGVFIDVGAHVGLWSLQMSEWYQNRYHIVPTIYAIEPDATNYLYLRQNAEQDNTGIISIQAAAWHKNEQLFLRRHENPGRHQVTSYMYNREAPRTNGIALDVIADTVKKRQVDVVKIDVEGVELNVLNGMRQILIDNQQMLLVVEYSINHFYQYGYTPAQITAFIEQHGFRPAREIDYKATKNIRADEIRRVIFVKGEIT